MNRLMRGGSSGDQREESLVAETRSVMRRHGVHPKKRFGQNFLVDEQVLSSILESIELSRDDVVIEIGPGLGVLTRELAKAARLVIAVEIDRGLFEILSSETAHLDNVMLLNEDILEIDLPELLHRQGASKGKVKVAANLPYNITTPVLVKLIGDRDSLDRVVVMVQREVAERVAASPGSRSYGSLSVFMQWYAEVRLVQVVPPESFVPAPKVHSAVLCIDFLSKPRADVDSSLLETVVHSAFAMRRKILKNALKGLPGLDERSLELLLSRTGIDPSCRAETLSLEDYAALAREYAQLRR